MTPERYAEISEIFENATGIPAGERGSYLDRTCGEDDELKDEVLALLAHHDPEPDEPADVTAPSDSRFPKIRFHRKRTRGSPLVFYAIIAASLLAVTGISVHRRLDGVRSRQLENKLTTVLDADVAAVRLWIDFVIGTTQRWGGTPGVVRTAEQMLNLAEEGMEPLELVNSEANQSFLDMITPVTKLPAVRGVHMMAPGVGLLASTPVEGTFQAPKLTVKAMTRLMRSMQGETIFLPPYMEHSRVTGLRTSERVPITSVTTPVFGKSGQPIAVLNLRWRVDEDFARLFSLTRLGETGETYAFDRTGVVVSPLRNEGRLRELGVIASDAPPGTALNVLLRDPGGDLASGHQQGAPRGTLPLTRLAAQATTGLSGSNITGYRNFSGRKVVGAWKWIDEYGFGIAAEIDYAEAYATSRSVRNVFAGLFTVLLGTAAFAFARERIHIGVKSELDHLREIGPYEIEGVLGEGGMGSVYLGKHRLLKRPIAIKVIRENLVGPAAIRRFEREVSAMSHLKNSHTVHIYDFGVNEDGSLYYAMEYFDGMTLEELVGCESKLPWARVVFLLKQVCGSLIEAHASGLIHRDLKPQNFMVTCPGGDADFVTVLDFGLVKDLETQDSSASSDGSLVGTPLYMAPERMRNPGAADQRSDIYSLGAICYYMLTGERAFQGVNTLDSCFRAMTEAPPVIARGDGIPDALIGLIEHCLAGDPADRPASVEEMLRILDELPITGWNRGMAKNWWEDHKKT
jgi:tRNA A-37 threonylcarbamoyl transferase component Bud32